MTRVLVTTMVAVGLLTGAAEAPAAEVVAEVRWDAGAFPAAPEGVELSVGSGEPARLEVVSGGGRRTVALARIDSPAVGWPGWRVDGQVVLEELGAAAFAEMWVVYPDGARYFSRSVSWPAGASGEVDVSLPFRPDASSPAPVALEIRLVLEGPARLAVGPLRLVRADRVDDLTALVSGAWWSERTGAVVGAAGGTALGLLGALLGVLVARGVALRLAAAGLLAVAVAGVAAVAAAAVGLATGQPYGVWYPLGLLGLIAAVVGFALRPVARRRAVQIEIQRMRAADL